LRLRVPLAVTVPVRLQGMSGRVIGSPEVTSLPCVSIWPVTDQPVGSGNVGIRPSCSEPSVAVRVNVPGFATR
jgi:hypothetical protein